MTVAKAAPIFRRIATACFWLAMLVTLGLAFAPGGKVPHLFPWDKAEHFAAFYVLAVLAAAAAPRVSLWRLGLLLSMLGGAIELVQAIPMLGRDCDVFDWAADTAAVLCAYVPAMLPLWRSRFWPG
jgi:hypothetical protein